MNNLIKRTQDISLREYENIWLEYVNKSSYRKDYENPSLSLYTSMVYGFANHLPYSMDIEQPEYVPADFLNMMPQDVEENQWFKFEDKRTFFNAMVRWGDTFKSGMLLQICNVFQKMLLGQFPSDFVLKEEDFTEWGIDTMTKDKEYNRCFFETLKSLPGHYLNVVNTATNEERRKALDNMYNEVMNNIAQRVGGIKITGADGTILKEEKGSVSLRPHRDVEMMVHWENVVYHDGLDFIIQSIREKQLDDYNQQKFQLLESNDNETTSNKRQLMI